jgi:hypothetical protein
MQYFISTKKKVSFEDAIYAYITLLWNGELKETAVMEVKFRIFYVGKREW